MKKKIITEDFLDRLINKVIDRLKAAHINAIKKAGAERTDAARKALSDYLKATANDLDDLTMGKK